MLASFCKTANPLWHFPPLSGQPNADRRENNFPHTAALQTIQPIQRMIQAPLPATEIISSPWNNSTDLGIGLLFLGSLVPILLSIGWMSARLDPTPDVGPLVARTPRTQNKELVGFVSLSAIPIRARRPFKTPGRLTRVHFCALLFRSRRLKIIFAGRQNCLWFRFCGIQVHGSGGPISKPRRWAVQPQWHLRWPQELAVVMAPRFAFAGFGSFIRQAAELR
jgi:hypothetical protein